MFCRKCGFEVSEDTKFCPNCGESTTVAASTPEEDNLGKFYNYERPYSPYDRAQIKKEAKDLIKGNNWIALFGVLFLISLVYSLTQAIYIGVAIAGLVSIYEYYVVKNLFVTNRVDLEYVFKPMKRISEFGNFFLKQLGLFLLFSLIVLGGTILFIIPGIIFSLKYGFCFFALADDPDISVTEALKKSAELTDGHKWEYFVFGLSFIGHFLLLIITLGIYSIYFTPYQSSATVNYYFYLKSANKNKNTAVFREPQIANPEF